MISALWMCGWRKKVENRYRSSTWGREAPRKETDVATDIGSPGDQLLSRRNDAQKMAQDCLWRRGLRAEVTGEVKGKPVAEIQDIHLSAFMKQAGPGVQEQVSSKTSCVGGQRVNCHLITVLDFLFRLWQSFCIFSRSPQSKQATLKKKKKNEKKIKR